MPSTWNQVWHELRKNLLRQPRCPDHPMYPCIRTLSRGIPNDIIEVTDDMIVLRSHSKQTEKRASKRGTDIRTIRAQVLKQKIWEPLEAVGSLTIVKDSLAHDSIIRAILQDCLPQYVHVDGRIITLRRGRHKAPQQPNDESGSKRDMSRRLGQYTEELEADGYFDPTDKDDERDRVTREIAQRQGGGTFRKILLEAYDGKCAVTECDAEEALEAAHISRYLGAKSNHVTNGLLLRADIHTLLDRNLIGIDPRSRSVTLAASIRGTSYSTLKDTELRIPQNKRHQPNKKALQDRWDEFCQEWQC